MIENKKKRIYVSLFTTKENLNKRTDCILQKYLHNKNDADECKNYIKQNLQKYFKNKESRLYMLLEDIDNNIVYEGAINSKGEKDGNGKLINRRNNTRYEGDWEKDKFNGRGTYTYKNGDKYNGEFKDGKKNGKGKYILTDTDCNRYEGIIKNKEYKDKYIPTKTQILLEGKWENDKPLNIDILTKKDDKEHNYLVFKNPIINNDNYNIRSDGELVNDECDNKEYSFANNMIYKGPLLNGKFYKKGILYDENYKYEGEFKDGKKNGYGEENISKGATIYKGTFSNNAYNGKGVLTFNNSIKHTANFKEGHIHGECTIEEKTGKYEGFYYDSEKYGEGTYTTLEGDRYEGIISDCFTNGEGTIFYKNGITFKGKWMYLKKNTVTKIKNNKKVIKIKKTGNLTFHNSDTILGIWEDDKLIENGVFRFAGDDKQYPCKFVDTKQNIVKISIKKKDNLFNFEPPTGNNKEEQETISIQYNNDNSVTITFLSNKKKYKGEMKNGKFIENIKQEIGNNIPFQIKTLKDINNNIGTNTTATKDISNKPFCLCSCCGGKQGTENEEVNTTLVI